MIMKTAASVFTALLAIAPLATTATTAADVQDSNANNHNPIVDDVNAKNLLKQKTTMTMTTTTSTKRRNEYVVLEGHTVRDQYHSPLPYTYIQKDDLPDNFDWRSVDGVSYTTHSLNQVRKHNE